MAWDVYDPFPTSALGRRPARAIQQHHVNTGVAIELIAPIALALAGVPVADLYDVVRPNCSPSPTVINVCVVAATGEAKDTGAAPFIAPIRNFQAAQDDEIKAVGAAYQAELRVWKIKERRILRAIDTQLGKGAPIGDLQFDLAVHMSAKPRAPEAQDIIFSDITRAALTQTLCHSPRSLAGYTMEAGRFFNGPLISDMPFWNDVWSGTPILSETVTHGRVAAHDPRVSMILGIQREPYARFLRRCGAEAHDSGFTARFLMSFPPSTVGFRLLSGGVAHTEHIEDFSDRITALLETAALRRTEGRAREAIEFTPGAARYFVHIYNNLQVLMRPGNPYRDITGQAAKAAENVARLAVILHAIDDLVGRLDEETLYRAASIVEWHVNQFMRMVMAASPAARVHEDAEMVLQGLLHAHRLGQATIARKDLRFWMPGEVTAVRITKAVHVLVASGRMGIFQARGREFVMLPTMALPNR